MDPLDFYVMTGIAVTVHEIAYENNVESIVEMAISAFASLIVAYRLYNLMY